MFLGNLSLVSLSVSMNQAALVGSATAFPCRLSLKNVAASRFSVPFLWNPFSLSLSGGRFSKFLTHVIRTDSVVSIYREDVTSRPTFDLDGENITVNESTFTDITCGTDGGAIFAIFPGDLLLYQVNFVRVSSNAKGGTIFFHGNNLTLRSCCFTQCSAVQGMAVFNARTKNKTLVEGCHCFGLSGGIYGMYLCSYVGNLRSSNFSAASATGDGSAFYVEPIRSMDVNDCAFVANKGTSVVVCADVYRAFEFKRCNCIKNEGAAFVNVVGFDVVLSEWAFVGNVFTSFASSASADMTVTLNNCSFDVAKDKLAAPAWVTFDSACKFGATSTIDLGFVETGVCWQQNRYKFEEPPLYKKIIIGCVFGLCFVIVIIILIVNDCKDKKRMKEIMAEHDVHEGLNQHIALADNTGDGLKKERKEQKKRRNAKK